MDESFKYRFIITKAHKLHRALSSIVDYTATRGMDTYRVSILDIDKYAHDAATISNDTVVGSDAIPLYPLMQITEYLIGNETITESNNLYLEFHTTPLKTSYIDLICQTGIWDKAIADRMSALCAHKVLIPSDEMDMIPRHVQDIVGSARHAKRDEEVL